MKTAILFALIALSTSVFADAEADRNQAKAWIKAQQDILPRDDKQAATAFGEKCNVYFSYLNEGSIVYLVVGDNSKTGDDSYVGIGLANPDTKVTITGNSYSFDMPASWGNKSTRNKVTVDVDGNGKPKHAIGESDLQKIECDLK